MLSHGCDTVGMMTYTGIYLSGNITRRYVSTLNYVHAFRDMLLIQLGVVCMKIKVNISLNETLDLSFP